MLKSVKYLISFILVLVLIGSTFIFWPLNAATDAITISGTEFRANGSRIWMNGANTPWNNWNDFGGNFNADWWSNHFQQLHDNGINSSRIWITCSGEVGINIDDSGKVSGATEKHWKDLDKLFELAKSKNIYIMATLISFDHFKNTYTTYNKWRKMITSSSNIDSYVENYVTPFVNRYKSNPYLWSIDLCNEPDWIFENEECGKISWDWLQTYFAKSAAAIHQNSNVLVTVGTAMIKYNSDTCSGAQGNKISDKALQAKVNSPGAKVDFYSTHYYDWMGEYWGNIFYQSPTKYGLDNTKPSMIGENPAKGTSSHTITEDYENCYQNGWQGAMAWTSNGVDSNGGMNELGPATKTFLSKHKELVFPAQMNVGSDTKTIVNSKTNPSVVSTAKTNEPKNNQVNNTNRRSRNAVNKTPVPRINATNTLK